MKREFNQWLSTMKDSIATWTYYTDFEKVYENILSWGAQAQPLSPARLVKRWKDEIKAMAKIAEGGKK